jgi:sugar phosphate permease
MNNQAASIAAIPALAPLEIEATATRKVWTRIVPFVFVLFVIN